MLIVLEISMMPLLAQPLPSSVFGSNFVIFNLRHIYICVYVIKADRTIIHHSYILLRFTRTYLKIDASISQL